jgi:hypothetical protein
VHIAWWRRAPAAAADTVPGVYGWLLFFHVLAAFSIVATVVVFSALALGLTRDARVLTVSSVLWGIGGLGTLVFGVWLALYVSSYRIYDGWIIAALVLWAIATGLGQRAEGEYREALSGGGGTVDSRAARSAALFHWLRSIVVLALLVVMIYKPGA